MSAVQRNYDDAENREEILARLGDDESTASDEEDFEVGPEKSLEGRQTVAAEEQPGEDGEPPDLRETTTVEFRGHEFEFQELGDRLIEAAKFKQHDDEVEAGTQAADYVYQTLGECGVKTNEAYWRRYDFQNPNADGVMDVFERLMGEIGDDLDPEEAKQARNFREE